MRLLLETGWKRAIALNSWGFVAVMATASTASAQDRAVVVSVDGGTCVTQAALRDAVVVRGGKISDDAVVRLRVKVDAPREGNVSVEVAGQGAHGALAERRFVASSCRDALDALGLVVALAADDDAAEDRAPSIESPVAPATAPERDAAKEAPAPAADGKLGPPTTFALRAGAIGTTFGEGQLGARLSGSLEWKRMLLPWIEAAATITFPHTIDGGGGGADARWITARLAAAPVGFQIGDAWRLSLFGAFDVGALGVSGSGPARVESRSRTWLAVAAGARMRWDLGPRFFAGLDAAAVVPLVRDEFVFVNGGSAYRVPGIGAETAIFAGVHFP